MKKQTLILMALSGACAAVTISSTSQVDSLSTINQESQDDVNQVLHQISSGEVEFSDPVVLSTDTQVKFDTGLDSTTTNNKSTVTLLNGEPTDQNINLQSFSSYFNKGSLDPSSYIQNQNSVRSDEINKLKKQNYSLQDQLDNWGPMVLSVMDETRQNSADTKQLQDASDQYAMLSNTLDQNVQSNSSRLQKLEGNLKSEYDQINTLGNSLESLQKECQSTKLKSQGDIDQINGLNQQILLTMTKSHDNLTNVSNELKVVSEEYITLNSGFNKGTKDESQQIEKLRTQIRQMAKDIEGNYNFANANISQLNSYFTTVDQINDRVSELQQAIDGPIKTKISEFKQTRDSNNKNLTNFVADYDQLKNFTQKNFDEVKQGQDKAYGHLEDEFSQLKSNLKLQKASNISLKKGMDDQITLTSSMSRNTDKQMEKEFNNKLVEEEKKLNNYQQIFNEKNQQCQANLNILRENLERLNSDFQDTQQQHSKKVLNLKKSNKFGLKQLENKVTSLQGSLNEMGQQNEIKLESQFNLIKEDQDKQDQLRQNDIVLLSKEFDALKNQEDEIITLTSSIDLGNRKMGDTMEQKYSEMKNTINEFEEQFDQAGKEYKNQLKTLKGSYKQALDDSKSKDDLLKNWIQSTYDEMKEFETYKDAEEINLRNNFKQQKEQREKDKQSTDNIIQNYLKSWKDDKEQGNRKYSTKLQKVMEDRDRQTLSLKADIGSMNNKVRDILQFMHWRNGWQKGAFDKYLDESQQQELVKNDYSTGGTNYEKPSLSYSYKDEDNNVTAGELKDGDKKKFKLSKENISIQTDKKDSDSDEDSE